MTGQNRDQQTQDLLAVLARAAEPLSGRRVAELSGQAQSSISAALRRLADTGAVRSTPAGRAQMWTITNEGLSRLNTGGTPQALTQQTVLIVTALPIELAAVSARLATPQTRRSRSGIRYLDAEFTGENIQWRVTVAEVGMGIAATATAATDLANELGADLLMFVGIAGGLKSDELTHGDVVVGETVLNVNQGKQVEGAGGADHFLPRTTSRNAPAALVQLAKDIARRPLESLGISNAPNIFVRPIASGESVLTYDYPRIKQSFSQAFSIDMESFGLMQAAHDLRLPGIAIRGISDLVADKTPADDRRRQPIAARNAASVALTMLRDADLADIDPRPPTHKPDGAQPGSASSDLATAQRPARFPPGIELWLTQLGKVDQILESEARADLGSGVPAATRLSRALHRPPSWIRADPTPTGWILLAAIGERSDAKKTPDVLDRAAEAANADSPTLSRWLAFSAHMHRVRAKHPYGGAEAATELGRFDLNSEHTLRPIVDAYAAVFTGNPELISQAAPAALAAAGYTTMPALRALWPGQVATAEPADIPPLIREAIQVTILVELATAWLSRDVGESAFRAAEAALRIRPTHPTAALRREQADLVRLHAEGHSLARDTFQTLTRIERAAERIRLAQQQYNDDSAEALALGARARFENGDPRGALAMLLPPPRGTARHEEAKTPAVQLWVAHIAAVIGDNQLALEAAEHLPESDKRLAQADVFSHDNATRDMAISYYRQVLSDDDARTHHTYSAVLGLARLKVDPTDPDLAARLDHIHAEDPLAADFIRSTALLAQQRYEEALRLIRPHRNTLQAAELEARIHEESGNSDAAVRALDRFATSVGDSGIRMQAVRVALRNHLLPEAHRLADLVLSEGSPALRRDAREAKAAAGRAEENWNLVDAQLRGLIADDNDTGSPADPATRTRWHWQRIEALFHLRDHASAFNILMSGGDPQTRGLTPENPQQARVALSIAGQVAAQDPEMMPDDFFDWLLAITANFIDDDQVARIAVQLILTVPVEADESQLVQARTLLQNHLERDGSRTGIRSIKVLDDDGEPQFSELERFMKEQAERESQLAEIVGKHLLGQIPLSVVARLTGRTYTELLVSQAMGCDVVEDAISLANVGRVESADAAVKSGRVVADISALVMGPKLGVSRGELTSFFNSVLIPSSVRDDVLQARSSLSMQSTMSMGYDLRQESLRVVERDPATVEVWTTAAVALLDDVKRLDIVPDVKIQNQPGGPDRGWAAPLYLAQDRGVPLWADDVALRHLAKEFGVPTFSTEDLLHATQSSSPVCAEAVQRLQSSRQSASMVEWPVTRSWRSLAAEDDWDPTAYTGLLLSRPTVWLDIQAGLRQYIDLMRGMPTRLTTGAIVGWATRAASGLAWSLESRSALTNRAAIVAPLLAWVAVNNEPLLSAEAILENTASGLLVSATGARLVTRRVEPAEPSVFAMLLDATAQVEWAFLRGGRLIEHVITVILDTLRAVADAGTAARMVVRAVRTLPDDTRARAMQAVLSSPPVAPKT